MTAVKSPENSEQQTNIWLRKSFSQLHAFKRLSLIETDRFARINSLIIKKPARDEMRPIKIKEIKANCLEIPDPFPFLVVVDPTAHASAIPISYIDVEGLGKVRPLFHCNLHQFAPMLTELTLDHLTSCSIVQRGLLCFLLSSPNLASLKLGYGNVTTVGAEESGDALNFYAVLRKLSRLTLIDYSPSSEMATHILYSLAAPAIEWFQVSVEGVPSAKVAKRSIPAFLNQSNSLAGRPIPLSVSITMLDTLNDEDELPSTIAEVAHFVHSLHTAVDVDLHLFDDATRLVSLLTIDPPFPQPFLASASILEIYGGITPITKMLDMARRFFESAATFVGFTSFDCSADDVKAVRDYRATLAENKSLNATLHLVDDSTIEVSSSTDG